MSGDWLLRDTRLWGDEKPRRVVDEGKAESAGVGGGCCAENGCCVAVCAPSMYEHC